MRVDKRRNQYLFELLNLVASWMITAIQKHEWKIKTQQLCCLMRVNFKWIKSCQSKVELLQAKKEILRLLLHNKLRNTAQNLHACAPRPSTNPTKKLKI
uniref:Uncharacterized protein n=1 Tax=Romanomermis culicivorax TaxID=13658 RepID=A0A915J241_ROMCU